MENKFIKFESKYSNLIANKVPEGWEVALESGVFLDKDSKFIKSTLERYIAKGYELGKEFKIVLASEIAAQYKFETLKDNISCLVRNSYYLVIRQQGVLPAKVIA